MAHNKTNLELEIILVLVKNKAHLRSIARTLNESHSTVLRKINDFLKKNVLDYKKEGRNKVFFIKNNLTARNYVYSAEIYKLSKTIEKCPELSIIFEDIKKEFQKGMILLFGSYAKGNPKQESDIDIYLETTDSKVKSRLNELNSRLGIKTGRFDVKSPLIKEIIKDHVIIRGVEEFYERNEFFKED